MNAMNEMTGMVLEAEHDEALDGGARILEATLALLRQGEEMLRAIPAPAYVARVPEAFHGTIGGHYRHCLDHFVSVLRGMERAEVDYDARDRDPRIEGEPAAALALTEWLGARLARLTPAVLGDRVRARCEVSYAEGGSPVMTSSLGRELAYAIAHAIHHYALIAVMARLQGVRLPEEFGLAPSTLAYRKAVARGSAAAVGGPTS